MAKYLNIGDISFLLKRATNYFQSRNSIWNCKPDDIVSKWHPKIGEVVRTRLEWQRELVIFLVTVEVLGVVVSQIDSYKMKLIF